MFHFMKAEEYAERFEGLDLPVEFPEVDRHGKNYLDAVKRLKKKALEATQEKHFYWERQGIKWVFIYGLVDSLEADYDKSVQVMGHYLRLQGARTDKIIKTK